MKHIIVLCDGMSDDPAGGATVMAKAYKPHMDFFASRGMTGRARTIPDGLPAGSDVANLTVLGYDASRCYTGRSPLEAASLGLTLENGDWAYRCNLVTLSDHERYQDRVMLDYGAGDVTPEEAAGLMAALQDGIGDGRVTFHPGSAYRHCMIMKNGADPGDTVGPHDISGQAIGPHLNAHLAALQERGAEILKGRRSGNAIWLWGQGTKPALEPFEAKYGMRGAVISAVDLLRGIGRLTGMETVIVPGATGYLDTCFEAKTQAALDALAGGCGVAYLHFEAPDECAHRGEAEGKVQAIELIDARCLAILRRELPKLGGHRILILPDHATPLSLRTHSRHPVPFLLYDSREKHPPLRGHPLLRKRVEGCFDETSVAHCEPIDGLNLMTMLLGRRTGGG